jgi:hypothetical protein
MRLLESSVSLLFCLATLGSASPIFVRESGLTGFLPGNVGLNITYTAPANR